MASSLVPAIYHPEELDGVLPMDTDEAWDVSERLAKEEGMLVGHSSGASLAGGAAHRRAAGGGGQTGRIATFFPYRAERYFEAPVPPQTRESGTIARGRDRRPSPPV